MCATTAGPYHSPACFPISRPRRTILWRPNWADGLSPNQDTRVRWNASSMCTPASSADPVAWLWGPLWSEGPGEPCREDSREVTRRLAAEVVQVSVSKGCNDIAPDQVQSSEEETRHDKNIHMKHSLQIMWRIHQSGLCIYIILKIITLWIHQFKSSFPLWDCNTNLKIHVKYLAPNREQK